MAIIAVDLVSNSVTLAVFGRSGRIFEKEKLSIDKLSGLEVSKLIQTQIDSLVKKYKNNPLQIKSIGIGVPGIYYSKTGTVWAPNIPGWDNYPLKKDLNYLLIKENILTRIASKRTCDILGEKWQGVAKKSKNALFLSVGNGIGTGVLIDGKILHGFSDIAGAAGWIALSTKFKPSYSEKGFLESLASWKGIKKKLNDYILNSKSYNGLINIKKLNTIQFSDLIKYAENKDKIAKKIINESIVLWGTASANLISMFNPEVIIFGGSLFGPGLIYIEAIRKEAEKWAQPYSMKDVKFCGSKLGTNAGLYGAGFLAMKKI